MSPEEFKILRSTVRAVLESAKHFEWSLQGFGMLRCYLSKETRLHVWSQEAKVVSNIHDHPWDFHSVIVSGEMVDCSYSFEGSSTDSRRAYTHEMQTIKCGPGGCANGDRSRAFLKPISSRLLTVGSVYQHGHRDLHESFASDGCVSIIQRIFHADTETARVAVPAGQSFRFVEPRPATSEEVESIVGNALSKWA